MDFFEHQDRARKNTKLLIFYFVIAVGCIITSVYFAVLLIFHGAMLKTQGVEQARALVLWDPQIFMFSAVATLAVVCFGSLYKIFSLSGNGGSVAKSLGGRVVAANTRDPDERRLLNVVEEMAIASGVPVPQVYILEDENRINAFAAGNSPSNAVIGVTHGCVKLLNRDELQGVIAHEYSHILNGDMRLNVRLMGVVFGILCLAVIGRTMLYVRVRGRNNKGGGAIVLLGLALLVIGGIGVFFSRLIQAAVCRQREFLADASSVQFTRNPDGLSGALQKIGGLGSKLESPHAEEASHFFFSNGMGKAFLGSLATHPPLAERIKTIDPNWDGNFKAVDVTATHKETRRKPPRKRPGEIPFPRIPGMRTAQSGAADFATAVVATGAVLPSLGKPTTAHLQYAEELRDSFSENLETAAHEPLSATALVYALLLSPEKGLREEQLTELARQASPEVAKKTAELWPEVAELISRARLPLINLSLTALRQMQPDNYKAFMRALKWLIQSDQKIDLFEFVLQKILNRHLAPHFGKSPKTSVQYYSLNPLLTDCLVLLCALAKVSSTDQDEIEKAFQTGVYHLDDKLVDVRRLHGKECGLSRIDDALDRLELASPQIKKRVIDACAHVVGADGVIQEREAELLRAIADTLDCPIPPFLRP
ncbi:MAG: M48 family metalloprotease [Planctomycetes bacterium]|nr:M48 family metalloprotease [Planctomycetota bacterium]